MLVRPKGPKPKGFLGAAKSTDQLPCKIICYEEIIPQGHHVILAPSETGVATTGPCYTEAQRKEIKKLASEGKIMYSDIMHNPFLFERTAYKLAGTITTESQAKKLGVPLRPQR